MCPEGRIIVIENYEEWPSRWVIGEYLESYRIAVSAGFKLVVANVTNPYMESLLLKFNVPVLRFSGARLYDTNKTIVLDLWADKPLAPHEAQLACVYVIGGIMGDHPPRGRGRIMRLSYTNSAYRNLGPKQFSVDGVVKVLDMVINEGRDPLSIEVVDGLNIEIPSPWGSVTVSLPYAYPKGYVPSFIKKLLESGVAWDEV